MACSDITCREAGTKTWQNVPQVRLWDEDVTHGQHAEPAQLFGGVEDHGREAARHFGVEADLDTRLDFVLTFHQKVQQLLSIDHRLAEVRHEADQSRVPLVHNLQVNKKNDFLL